MTPDARFDHLPPDRRALLEARLAKLGDRARAAGIPRLPRGSELPLSFAQQRLWFLHQLEPGSVEYNIPHALRVHGWLDVAALRRALSDVVARHGILRTTFATVDGQPVQVIHDPAEVALEVTELSHLDREKRELEARELAAAEATRHFDLEQGPLLRARVLRLDRDDHVLLLNMHHIVSDGWSRSVLLNELSTLYDAHVSGERAELDDLSIQYADFAAWQRRSLEGEVLEGQLAYWRERLAGLPPVLELPTDRPRPPVRSGRGSAVSFEAGADTLAALKTFGRAHNATLFMTLAAAFQALLSRYSGSEDVAIGTPVAGRSHPEAEPLIGFFVNTLVLRTDLSGDPTFSELVGRVRDVALGAYAHQEVPFEKLVEELHPQRSTSHTPLFQVMLALDNTADGSLKLGDAELQPFAREATTAKFDLTLGVVEDGSAVIEYSADLFEVATVERMAGHLQNLLEAVASDPDRALSELEVMSVQERHHVVVELNDTAAGYPAERCIHELFEAQARETPDAIALISAAAELGYGELNAAANRLAHHLLEMGVGPEVAVGICLERGADFVVAALAISKAGGAYVPLDPANPTERLSFMLKDTAAPVMVTASKLAGHVDTPGVEQVLLDEHESVISARPATNPRRVATPQDLAYVIYTSGSTGTPKGVAVAHRSLVNLVSWHIGTYGVTPGDRATHLVPLGFDASVLELWPYLSSGATLVFAPEQVRTSPAELVEWVDDNGITFTLLPTALVHEVFRSGLHAALSVRAILTGGDQLRVRPDGDTSFDLVNHYGPTEATVAASAGLVEAAGVTPPSIGRPISNTAIYILDPYGNPVPKGVPGELYIGGAGVARGYVNRPGETAERFVPDPFSGVPGARLYRTGDRARYLQDGDIEFLGRVDHQVKIRGFRIEPGEIEASLVAHEAIRDAVVVARSDDGADKRLVAYFTALDSSNPLGPPELRAHSSRTLPDYMVPAHFVVLDELPLTPNGKVDRGALPAPDARPEADASYVAPRTPAEEVLAGIWCRVLGLERVGIHDDFFELGGHSLVATQVVSRARDALSVELPLRALFDSPTVAELAAVVAAGEHRDAPPIEPVPRDSDLPLSFAQQRLWFLDQLEPGSAEYNIPYALRVQGALDVDSLGRALTDVVARHETLRTTFPTVDGEPVLVIHAPREFAVDVTPVDELEAQRIAEAEAACPFDLEQGPLLRARVLRLDHDDHVLLLNMHHIVSDGWSGSVLLNELSMLYDAYASGERPRLHELPIQYADFAAWQREWLSGEVLEGQLAYWRDRLAGLAPVLELPTDHPRPAVKTSRGRSHSFVVDGDTMAALDTLARRHDATSFMTLTAAFQALLSRYSGSDDIAIGTPIAGRTRAELEDLVGFFVNTLVLRTDLSGDPSFGELVGRVRDAALGAYAHQDVPFEKLVDELHPQRTSSHTPLFQVMFALDKTAEGELTLGDAELQRLALDTTTAKFDLTLGMAGDGAAVIEYNADLFEPITIERMAGHLTNLLKAVASDPGLPLCEIDFMAESERRHVVVELNDTGAGYPDAALVHELFETQVRENADRVALVFDDDHLTYSQLDAAANRLAHHLVEKGVGAEVPVGICLDRRSDLVVGLLAVLKAGGAYVPLDPEYPTERLAFMLRDSGCEVVVTDSRDAARVRGSNAEIVVLEADAGVIEGRPDIAPPRTASPEDLAYVIYTSGSTGTPKGVAVTHRSLVNLVSWHTATYGVAPGDRATHVAPLGFDASVWELWPYLSTGATVVLPPEHVRTSPSELVEWLGDNGITVTFLPTALVHEVFAAGLHAAIGARTILTGGDQLRVRPDDEASFELVNHYGPTEATVVASAGVVEQSGVMPPSIGRPIANTAIYILDPHGNPVPKGVPGELYVGGAGLARGYVNRPGLTAERFVPDPFSGVAGARLYRTGDRARHLETGDVEFLGRVDHQVKIRGFRIEPGEIEACLVAHDAIRDAVVVARSDAGDKRLVAYVVGDDVPTTTELRAHVSETLPDYMVPAHFVVLDELPLTPNGKLDRAALPAAEGRPELEGSYVAPRTPAEEVLAGIWCEVLGLERVGVHDNFFELGGDSILSIQTVARSNAAGLGLTPRLLFQHQTVAGLASVAGERQEVAAEQGPVTGDLPLTPIQRWFFELDLPERHHFNQSMLLAADGTDPELVKEALAALVDHHDALRLRFSAEAGFYNAPAEDAEWFSVHDGELEATCAELQASLDLERGPLLRAAWFDLGERRARLFVCIHHLAVDGVSWRILLEDLDTAYRQLDRGEKVSLAPKTTSFKQWAERLSAYASSDAALAELDYWSTGVPFELPVDFDRGPNDVSSAETVTVSLSEAETDALLHEVPAAYRTQINDVLVAAVARAISSWTGSDRVAIDLEGHGREDVFDDLDLTRTVGWFTSLFPVALQVDGSDPAALLKDVKEQLRALPHRGLGYGVLRYLAPGPVRDRLAGHAPLSFNYLGRFGQEATTSEHFSSVAGATGADHASSGERGHLVEINGSVSSGRLHMGWTYSANRHQRDTIEKVARDFVAALRELVVHCRDAGGVTPSDFPLARLDQERLDELWDRGLIDRSTQDLYPLTPLQQGMLFHTLYEPGSPVYFQQLRLTLSGRLDVDALRGAWRETSSRHEVLRSSVVWEGLEHPLSVVKRDVEPPLAVHDRSGLDESRLDAFLAEDRARGFELTKAPLLRLAVIATGPESWVLVWSFHHLLLDGWSVPLVLGELFSRYHALVAGEPLEVGAAPSYRDYVSWLDDRDRDADERFWREHLAGFAAPTPLGVDRPRRDGEGGYAQQHATLDEDVTAALESLARRHRVTLNTVVQGAWALLLARYSGETDVVLGATVSGRPPELSGVGEMVGLFINTVPVRVCVDGGLTIAEWLERIQEVALERGPFEHSALTDVHSWSEVPGAMPLFDSIVVFENYPFQKIPGDHASEVAIIEIDGHERTNYPLGLVVAPGDTVRLAIDYDRSRFDPATITRMTTHLTNLLEAVAADPQLPLSELDLLSRPERHHLLVDLNDAAVYPTHRCVHELFETQVRENPAALAVAFGDLELAYTDLNERANRLAHHLLEKGAAPGVPVGVSLERGPDLVVALLAVFKAGGVYVPLDPDYPPERLAFMLQDSGSALVVTDSRSAGRLSECDAEIVLLDRDAGAVALRPDKNPGTAVRPDDVAYVIYTSGSTGTPKGVMVTHGSLAGHCLTIAEHYALTPADRMLVFASFSFDAALEHTLAPLVSGASIVLRDAGLWDPEMLADKVDRFGITLFDLPTAYWHHVAANREVVERLCASKSLRIAAAGGEAMTTARARQWMEVSGGRLPLLNTYGPTEATITSTAYEVTERDALHGDTVPIGRPLGNTTVYVLDPYGNPVPTGVPGEVYIGGAGVASGYLNRPGLTASSFVPDPFSGVAGARLYRSGDRARYLEDGNLEFLGRVDHQVKIRGFRVEPGEIEACLAAHEAIRDAAVVARSDGGETRLVAYVVGDDIPATRELRAHVSKSLPGYMVPAPFVVLDELPSTANGKLDRGALPAPDARPDRGASYVAPRTPAEEVLAEIWCDVLGLERVGIQDDFFAVGGNSLVAIQVVSRARSAFDVEVPLKDLFDTPTIAALGTVIERLLLEEVEALTESDASAALHSMSSGRDEQREGP